MRILIVIYFVLSFSFVWGQPQHKVFSYDEFITIVKQHHPIAYQANLKLEKGEAYLLKSKGQFDPKLNGSLTQKYFDGTNYYSYLNTGLKIPTWFGVSAQAGYNQTQGSYINPELRTPNEGLWYAGLTVNLGQGLIIDQRRAELKQAKIYLNSSQIEQKLMLNQLIFDGSTAYWNWYKSYNKVIVYENAVKNAKLRFENVKMSAFLGDKPDVDTLKAIIQVQNRQVKLEQAKLELLNKKEYLETFLWQDGYVPLTIDTVLTPNIYIDLDPTKPLFYLLKMDSLVQNHPKMLYYKNNIDIAKIDYRLKKEKLKPTVQLKYNALSQPQNQSIFGDYSTENYNWGAKVVYPIFTRKERGDVKLSNIKIKEQESQLAVTQANLEYKIIASYNSWLSTHEQVTIYAQTVNNYNLLFESEYTLFNTGESSLFLVNFREQALIDAQLKLIDLLFKNYYSQIHYNYQTINTQ